MKRKKGKPNASAGALRAAGFVPIPRWWVRQEELDLIAYMARQHDKQVNRIRVEATRTRKTEIDAAWRQHLDAARSEQEPE